MMYAEYDWTFDVWRVRFGDTFTDWRGRRSFATRQELESALAEGHCRLGKKTDSRTFEIVTAAGPDLVCVETVNGENPIRLSFAIKCF